jgi:hypothetical protein
VSKVALSRPPLQQRRVRDDGLVPAGVAVRAHQVEHTQILKPESVAGGTVGLVTLLRYRTKDEHVNGR